jgi:hypothetical protein
LRASLNEAAPGSSSRTTNVFDFKNVLISRALANFICAERLNDIVSIIDRKMICFIELDLKD